MLLNDAYYYFDKSIEIEPLISGVERILGVPVASASVPEAPPGCVFISKLDAYEYTGFSLFGLRELFPSDIQDNYEMAKRLASEFDTQVVTIYDEGDNEFEYDWYLCDPKGNWFRVDMDPDEAKFHYETKRPAMLPANKIVL